MNKINWIRIDSVSKKIIGTGSCNDQTTFEHIPVMDDCELHEFTGGIIGQYFVDGEMQETFE